MKEITVIYNAQITQILRNLTEEEAEDAERVLTSRVAGKAAAAGLRDALDADDVNVDDLQVFIRDDHEVENV